MRSKLTLALLVANVAMAAAPCTSSAQLLIGPQSQPWGTASGGDGTLYVTDTGHDCVRVFSSSGALLRTLGSTGSGTGQLRGPTGITIGEDGLVYVADTGNNRIQSFDTSGNFLGTVYAGLALNAPHGLAMSGPFLYVADTNNHRVLALELWDGGIGSLPLPAGGFGSGDGQFAFPTGLAITPDGSLVVADTGNDRLVLCGTTQATFGTTGSALGQLRAPTGVAVDLSGNVYVVDQGNNRVQAFTQTGALVGVVGTGQLSAPSGIAWDRSSLTVAVADSGNDRVQSFATFPADLTPVSAVPPASLGLNQSFTVPVTVRNNGPATTYFSSVRGSLSLSSSQFNWNMIYCSGYVTVAPGTEQVVNMTCRTDYAMTPGSYYLGIRTYTRDGLADSTPANDILVVGPISIAP